MSAVQRFVLYNFLPLLPLFLFCSCATTITSALVEPALQNMQQQTDIELVCEGTPPYLLMIDSLIAGNSHPDFLQLGIKTYGGFIGAMTECGMPRQRIAAMADKALLYSARLMDQQLSLRIEDDFAHFSTRLETLGKHKAEPLFWAAFGLTVWIQQQQGTPAAMAKLGKIEKMLEKVVELDEKVQAGAAHFLLGGFHGSRPSLLGGNPEKSKIHFERALELSGRKQLIYQTVYAETYARNTMNKALHNMLLDEVIDFQLNTSPENMLANQIAKRKALRLMENHFFDD